MGVIRVLVGGIGPRVPCVMVVDSPEADVIDSGDAWVMRVCLVRGGGN